MAVVTVTEKHHLVITYFDGQDQLVEFAGFTVEGFVPHGCGRSCSIYRRIEFEVPVGPDDFLEKHAEVARILFCEHGLTSDQVTELLEDF